MITITNTKQLNDLLAAFSPIQPDKISEFLADKKVIASEQVAKSIMGQATYLKSV